MDLIEIGTALREGREQKGLTVEAVEEKTKIAPSVIIALEEGNSARFPHAVYARGFVRSYALLLGLDAQELCAHFSREYPVPKDSDQPDSHAPHIHVKMHDSGNVVTTVRIVAILGILLLGALGWYVFDHYRGRVPEAPAPVEEEMTPAVPPAEVLPSGSLPAPMTQMQEVAATPTQQPGAGMAANATSDEALNATTETPAAILEEAGPEPAQSAAVEPVAEEVQDARAEQSAAPATPVKERSLRIVAHSASWLQARPDDKILDYFLRKGETASITFRESLSIKFGNAGGVKLELDGQPYPFEGTLGEVKTLVVE
jgi:cytoskeleton protein RodZ